MYGQFRAVCVFLSCVDVCTVLVCVSDSACLARCSLSHNSQFNLIEKLYHMSNA